MSEIKIKNTTINFGPQHPSAHGVLRMIVELDGEIIKRVDPHIGLLHRGTEKLMEQKTYTQSIPYMDRLDYVSPIHYEHAWVLAAEKLLQLEVPKRAQYIRVLMSELSRISNHIFCIAALSQDCGAMTPMLWGFEEREKIMDIFEAITGARLHLNYMRVGGVAFDVSEETLKIISNWLPNFIKTLEDIQTLIRDNRVFKQRTVDIGAISSNAAIAYGFTGPNLRASGVKWDLRKAQPYEIYDTLDFDIIVGTNGDSYDRYLVRYLEIYESIKIIKQCLENIPKGLVKADNFKYTNPPRVELKTSMEALIHHFKFFSEGFSLPKGECYVPVEAPAGEFGIFLVSNGKNKPYRVKLRSSGLAHLQSLNYVAKGHQLGDIPAILGSYDLVFGETDR